MPHRNNGTARSPTVNFFMTYDVILFCFQDLLLLFLLMYYVSVHMHAQAREGVSDLPAGGCDAPDVGARNQTQS